MQINWKVRAKNPMFWVGLAGAVGTPIAAYMGVAAADLTTWESVGNLVVNTFTNPYLLSITGLSVLSFVGVVNDPTTATLKDSAQAMGYDVPRGAHMKGEV